MTYSTKTLVRCLRSMLSKVPRYLPKLPMAPPSSNASRMALYSASSFNSILPPGTIQRSGCRDEEMSKTYKKGGKIKIVINIVLTIILYIYIFRQEGNLLFLDNIYYLFLLIESVGLAGHFQCHYIKVR